jgi:hypothetical protein
LFGIAITIRAQIGITNTQGTTDVSVFGRGESVEISEFSFKLYIYHLSVILFLRFITVIFFSLYLRR